MYVQHETCTQYFKLLYINSKHILYIFMMQFITVTIETFRNHVL